ncbi:MAG: hypothetical protein AAGA35_00015 [Patescibacteria group bacterium]
MIRTYHTFSLLQAVAAILGLAILLWSFGFASLPFAEAANVTSFSNTLSDSAPSADANHTIEYVATSGVAASETIVITLPTGDFDLTGVGEEDVDLLENGVAESVGTNWLVTVGTTPDTITLTSQGASGVIAAGATTTILIGLHATNDGSPDTQIGNPSGTGSYTINVTSGSQDTGETRVAIVDTVTVTASVDTQFDFTVRGYGPSLSVNGDTTTGTTTPTAISFGQLSALTASTAAQRLDVVTNASNGFVVTVQVDQQLTSATGADINSFANGNNTDTPTSWSAPTGSFGSDNTYGHWGLASADATLGTGLTDLFGDGEYVAASTTPVEVFRNNGPADGSTAGVGTTQVAYRAEITSLQEAGDDYTATLTYVATPVF